MKDLESLYDLSTGIYMKKGKKTWGAERSGGGGRPRVRSGSPLDQYPSTCSSDSSV